MSPSSLPHSGLVSEIGNLIVALSTRPPQSPGAASAPSAGWAAASNSTPAPSGLRPRQRATLLSKMVSARRILFGGFFSCVSSLTFSQLKSFFCFNTAGSLPRQQLPAAEARRPSYRADWRQCSGQAWCVFILEVSFCYCLKSTFSDLKTIFLFNTAGTYLKQQHPKALRPPPRAERRHLRGLFHWKGYNKVWLLLLCDQKLGGSNERWGSTRRGCLFLSSRLVLSLKSRLHLLLLCDHKLGGSNERRGSRTACRGPPRTGPSRRRTRASSRGPPCTWPSQYS